MGDVHGCLPELLDLLERLGYRVNNGRVLPPPGRRLALVGDLVDRGPDVPGVLRLAMEAVRSGAAVCVLGNHDDKLRRLLNGEAVSLSAGRAASLAQLESEPRAFVAETRAFLAGLPPRLALDGGRLLLAHAGDRPDLPEAERSEFNVYGADTGRLDPHGYPERLDWASGYNGPALVVYGHTPALAPGWDENAVNLDTGCVYGGRLSALRYPEREIVSVPARAAYAPSRRFAAARLLRGAS